MRTLWGSLARYGRLAVAVTAMVAALAALAGCRGQSSRAAGEASAAAVPVGSTVHDIEVGGAHPELYRLSSGRLAGRRPARGHVARRLRQCQPGREVLSLGCRSERRPLPRRLPGWAEQGLERRRRMLRGAWAHRHRRHRIHHRHGVRHRARGAGRRHPGLRDRHQQRRHHGLRPRLPYQSLRRHRP